MEPSQNTQDQLIQGCFGEVQTPNTGHSSRNRDIHIYNIIESF